MEHCFGSESYWYQDGYCIPPMWTPMNGKDLEERCKKKIDEAIGLCRKSNGINQYSTYYNPDDGGKFEDEKVSDPLILFVKDKSLYVFHQQCDNPEYSIVPDMILEDYWDSIVPGKVAANAVKNQFGVMPLKLVRCGEIYIDKNTVFDSFLCTEWEGQLLPLQEYWQEKIEDGEKIELLQIPLNKMDEYNFEVKMYSMLDFAQRNYFTWATLLYHAGCLE